MCVLVCLCVFKLLTQAQADCGIQSVIYKDKLPFYRYVGTICKMIGSS